MATIQGTTGNDFLDGTGEDDIIYGLAGNDVIRSYQGNDFVYGGGGNDTLIDSYGDDFLDGGSGNDRLEDSYGNDILNGGDGDDVIIGYFDKGNDTLIGGNGNDTLDGGGGNDMIEGGSGNDWLEGGYGSDSLNGSNGNDWLSGFKTLDNATLKGDIDSLTGGTGKDTFVVIYTYDDGDPLTAGITDYALIKDFQLSDDSIQLAGAKSNYFLAASPNGLPPGTAIFFDKPGNQVDELIGIVEAATNLDLDASYFITTGDDRFNGTEEDDKFDAGEGDDVLVGNGGNDILIGGVGNDTLRGVREGGFFDSQSKGKDQIDTLTGGTGKDKFILGDTLNRYGSTVVNVYYDDFNNTTAGITDYALITDFDISQDIIQLGGKATDYILGSASNGLPAGTGIYLDKPNNEPDELIAILQGISPSTLSLAASYFNYV